MRYVSSFRGKWQMLRFVIDRARCRVRVRDLIQAVFARGPVFTANCGNQHSKSGCGRLSKQKPRTGFSASTAGESEEGWFQLALYNLSNLFLMLTVQYSLYLTLENKKKTLCREKKKKFVICYWNKSTVITDYKLSFCRNGSHEVLFVTLQYIKTPFFAVFCRSKTSTFLNSLLFVLYLFYIIPQDPARFMAYGLK